MLACTLAPGSLTMTRKLSTYSPAFYKSHSTVHQKDRLDGPPKHWHMLSHSLCHHHLHKFIIVDLPITIHVSLTNHLIHFCIRELLAQVHHGGTELACTDEAILVAVKHFEGLN